MDKTFEIDIKRLVLDVIRKIWIAVLAAAVGAVGMYAYAKNCLTPLYTASASLYVNSYINNGDIDIKRVNSSDIYTAQALVKTYLAFLKSDKVLDEVAQKLGGEYQSSQIRAMMSASSLDGTEIFSVQITSTDPKEAARIANIIVDMAPDVIMDYIEGSSVKVVDYAKPPNVRSFPVYRKYLMKGAAAGGGIALVFIVIIFIFNSKISTEEEIKRLFTAPVIGKIPSFDISGRGAYYKHGYKYEYKSKGEDG